MIWGSVATAAAGSAAEATILQRARVSHRGHQLEHTRRPHIRRTEGGVIPQGHGLIPVHANCELARAFANADIVAHARGAGDWELEDGVLERQQCDRVELGTRCSKAGSTAY